MELLSVAAGLVLALGTAFLVRNLSAETATRIFGGPCLGIAVLNWLARDAAPSPARNAIILGNLVGFGCVAANDVWGVFSGEARPIAKLFLAIHLDGDRLRSRVARPRSRVATHPT
jgi:hypothetical protein